MHRTLLLRVLPATALLATAIAACEPRAGDPTVGEPLPDTLPVAGTADELPEGMPLPPDPTDTLPRRP